MCSRCERPVSVCYCAAITTIETRSRIVILQHPREAGMPIGTAHMASLCLPQASVHVGTAWDESDVLAAACADPTRPPVLLYPGPDARDILREPPPAPVTLVVVDGTWSQARTLVRDNPRLAALPCYAFHAPEPSNYRIRREPCDEYVSTIEALMHVLGAIEGEPERFRALRRPMDAMVDAQIRAQQTAAAPEKRVPRLRTRPKLTPHERLPVEVRDRYEDLVLVMADANAWPHGTSERAFGDELIVWTALRPSTGEHLSSLVAPRHPLAPNIPGYVGFSAAELLAGGSVEEMLSAFVDFLRPTDVVASWGHHALRLLQDCGGTLPGPFLDLSATARLLTNRKAGSIEAHAAAAGIEATHDPQRGRAGRRVALLRGILDAWRALAPEAPSAG